MAANKMCRMAWRPWAFILCLSMVMAQNVVPSNDSSTLPPPGSPQFLLTTSQISMTTRVTVAPLTPIAGGGGDSQQLQKINFDGRLVLINDSNATSIAPSDIPYISCDPSAYTGNLGAYNVTATAVDKNPEAIIFYSETASHCNYESGNLAFNLFYTMTDANASTQLALGLRSPTTETPMTTITVNQSTISNSTNGTASNNNNDLGPAPTTAVAMIILYSITGIITALFLIIIVSGAIRAHRHPERYGPRAVLGRPRQSRAKGIARAMLETLPIVKFGDNEEENKPTTTHGDIELAATGEAVNTHQAREAEPSESSASALPAEQSHGNGAGGFVTQVENAHPEGEERTDRNDEISQDHNFSNSDRPTSPYTGPSAAEPDVGESSQSKSNQGEHHHDHNHAQDPEEITTITATDNPAAASGLPIEELGDEYKSDNGLACSVCTEDFQKGDDIRVLPCKHKYHPACVDPWLLNISGTCPLCRIDLRPTASHDPDAHDEEVGSPEGSGSDNMTNEGITTTRRHSGLGLHLHHTLNRGQLRDSTPEQRLSALRRLRTANREAEGSTDGERTFGSRLRGAFARRSAHYPEMVVEDAVTSPVDPARRPSYPLASPMSADYRRSVFVVQTSNTLPDPRRRGSFAG